jgi:hypothetical protein
MRCAIAKSSPQSAIQPSAKAQLELVRVATPAGARPARPARPLSPADVRRLGDTIRALAHGRKNSLHYYREVAKRVADELYDGNLAAMRSEGSNIEGESTFNAIARELSGTIKKTTLHRALWAYEVRETTPVYVLSDDMDADGVPTLDPIIAAGRPGVPTLERVSLDLLDRLGVSHLYEVRCLDREVRSLLLSRAVHAGWSVRRLRHEMEAMTGTPRRARVPAVLRLLGELGNVPATLDVSPLTTLSERDARRYQAIADKLHDLVRRAQEALAMPKPAKGARVMRYSGRRMRA